MNAVNPASAFIRTLALRVLCLLVFLLMCPVHAAVVVPEPVIKTIAYDAGSKQHPFVASILDLSALGYVESEFQMSGSANTYGRAGKWRSNGKWDVKTVRANVPYATRLLVRRPADPAKFNGIVVVEWLNNTAIMDVDVIWAQSHEELMREGYAWVGVSAQTLGVRALRAWDRQRYGELRLTTDGVSYDVFSQTALAVRSQSESLLGGLPVAGVIGAGESQSAIRLTTYVNAFQAAAVQVFDAMLLYSRFPLSAPLKDGITALAPSKVYIRADNALKILQLETEQDVFMFRYRISRQDDTELLRTWELAGASHYDDYGVNQLLPQYQRDFPQLGSVQLVCRNSLNKIPSHYVVNAALSSLTRWITTGQAPPQSPRLEYANGKVIRDANGNAVGGIRLPHMDAATATNNYNNYGSIGAGGNFFVNAFACPFLGNTVPFSRAKLQALYPTHQDYVSKFKAAADAALNAGFMVQADYEEAVAEAEVSAVP